MSKTPYTESQIPPRILNDFRIAVDGNAHSLVRLKVAEYQKLGFRGVTGETIATEAIYKYLDDAQTNTDYLLLFKVFEQFEESNYLFNLLTRYDFLVALAEFLVHFRPSSSELKGLIRLSQLYELEELSEFQQIYIKDTFRQE